MITNFYYIHVFLITISQITQVDSTPITFGKPFKPSKDNEASNTVLIDIYTDQHSTCSGSILHKRVVLTAGHCFISRKSGDNYYVPRHTDLRYISSIQITAHSPSSMQNRANRNPQIIQLSKQKDVTDQRLGLRQFIKLNKDWFKALQDKKENLLKHGDIALIVLPTHKAIDLTVDGIEPVYIYAPNWHAKIPNDPRSRHEWRLADRRTTVFGYGKTLIEPKRSNRKYISRYDRRRDLQNQSSKNVVRWSFFDTITKSACAEHLRNIGWTNSINILNIKNIVCAKGISNSGEYHHNGQQQKSQICSGDSGGPIFAYIDTTELVGTELMHTRIRAQMGVTILVDETCTLNFNGFLTLGDYLKWMKRVLRPFGREIFREIDGRVIPTVEHLDNFRRYSGEILRHRELVKRSS